MELETSRRILEERDQLIKVKSVTFLLWDGIQFFSIKEHGLVVFGDDENAEQSNNEGSQNPQMKKALVSTEVAALLQKAGEGSLGKKRYLISEWGISTP